MAYQRLKHTVLTHKQIAEIEGVSYQTIQKIERRAIEKIKADPLARQLYEDISCMIEDEKLIRMEI